MPHLNDQDAYNLITRRHAEFNENQRRWRWLQDSYEGGNRYRFANYVIDPMQLDPDPLWYYNFGFDPTTSVPNRIAYGQIVDCNLVPHISETSIEGRHLYALRLSRTPIPTVLRKCVHRHRSRIYSHEVQRRTNDPRMEAWWEDVDGAATPIDKWMRVTVGPLLLVLGQLDLVFDRPSPPAGAAIATKADADRYGLDGCVASFLLPENVTWWEIEPTTRRYLQVLAFCRQDEPHWLHWTTTDCNAYDLAGKWLPGLSREHRLGVCPVVRVFDERKHRSRNVGQSRYEEIAEIQKAIYNARSELILGDVLQSTPLLMGPEDYCKSDSEIPIGPGRLLPMKPVAGPHGVGAYQPFAYLDPPKGAQQEVRTHVLDWMDEARSAAALQQPAGAVPSSTVAQSGISKVMDSQEGNDLLSEIAEVLADCERTCVELVAIVLAGGDRRRAETIEGQTEVVYPREFDLTSPDDLANATTDLQGIASAGGQLPEVEKEMTKRIVAMRLPGLPEDRLQELHDEIETFFDEKAQRRQEMLEGQADWERTTEDSLTPGRADFASVQNQPEAGQPSDLLTSPEPA